MTRGQQRGEGTSQQIQQGLLHLDSKDQRPPCLLFPRGCSETHLCLRYEGHLGLG